MTRCWQLADFPHEFVAVHVTKFVPSEKLAGASFVTVKVPQELEVTSVPRFTPVAMQELLFAKTVTSAGQVMTGGGLSRVVALMVAELVLIPPALVARRR